MKKLRILALLLALCLLAAALGWREVRRLKRGETTFTLGMDSSAARAPST